MTTPTLPDLRALVERLHKNKLALDAVANSLRDKGQWTATIRAGNAMCEAADYLSSLIEQEPCIVCGALIVPRNATHYDADDLAAARKRGAIIAEQLAAPRPAVPQLTDEQIVEIRDDHLPSQGDSFDCIAFARAILATAYAAPRPASEQEPWRERELAYVQSETKRIPVLGLNEMRDAVRDLHAWATSRLNAAPRPAVPEGWKLVPVEPTHRMVAVCMQTGGEPYTGPGPKIIAEYWRAMCAAAPKPETTARDPSTNPGTPGT